MSTRCVFAAEGDADAYPSADVVVAAGATPEDIHRAAHAFAALGGPFKIFVESRTDPRFVEFVRYLHDDLVMAEGSDWGYHVRPLQEKLSG